MEEQYNLAQGCFQSLKDTNLKANHNKEAILNGASNVVSNRSKILIWKQITTESVIPLPVMCCFQSLKDTNLKANHNAVVRHAVPFGVVSNRSKILIWKQITTLPFLFLHVIRCFQSLKDTNLKANHNTQRQQISGLGLFPIAQRY